MDVINGTIEPARTAAAQDGAAKNGAAKNGAVEAKLTSAVRWRPPVLAATKPAPLPRNPSLPTFVGLVILILTFFIVLTSISMKDQTKAKAAIASLQDAFLGSAVTVEDVPKDEEVAEDYFAGLTHRIQSLVPLMGGEKGPASDHQVLWLPANLAFSADGVTLAPIFPTVLQEVVASLSRVPQRLSPQIEMRLCAREPSAQLRARAVAIGAALSDAEAPLDRFSLGIAQCDPARIGIAVALAPAAEEQAQ